MSRRVIGLVAANALLLAAAIASASGAAAFVPGPLRMLGSALLVLVLPGAAWLGVFRRRPLDPARLALAVVGLSSVASGIGLVLLAFAGPPPSREVFLVWTAAVVNAGLLIAGVPAPLASGRRWGLLAGIALAGFLVSACAGLWLVPPLEDHDMEVRGTAWGLATTLEPWFQTNREVYRAFAHPLLFHVHVAESLVATGEIEATRPSYESARRSQAQELRGERSDHMDAWQSDYRAFVASPALAGTRAPSALFAGLVLALLAALVMDLTGSAAAGVAAATLYAAFPQTIVRSAYAGYFAVAVFAMLAASMMFDAAGESEEGGHVGGRAGRLAGGDARSASRRRGWSALLWPAAAGAFCALVDHKTVVLVLGVAGLVVVRGVWDLVGTHRTASPAAGEPSSPGSDGVTARVRGALARVDPRAVALGAGFTTATLAWWGYGFLVDSPGFVRDHLRMHIAHRILLNDVRLAHDANRYAPSIAELWAELGRHTGILFLFVALGGIVLWLLTRARDDRRAVLAAWCLTGAVLFSLTDWRQTKHLMNEVAPMTAAAVVLAWPAFGARGRRGSGDATARDGSPRAAASANGAQTLLARVPALRTAALLALAVSFVVCLAIDARLVRDFHSLRVLGASDIDGW